MASYIATVDRIDQTIRIYDNFYNNRFEVNSNEYDVVFSYFKGISNNDQIAANMTAVLFRIAQNSGYSVIDLLEVIKGSATNLQLNTVLCYYLNTFKSKTSMYGVSNIPKPNEAVQRNVVP